ncbi:MAG: hypothetical protein ACE5QW_06990 [Thermoplasmata archaeon]
MEVRILDERSANRKETSIPQQGIHRKNQNSSPELSLRRLVTLQVLTIVVLLINSLLLFAVWWEIASRPAVLTLVSEDGVVLTTEQVVDGNVTYAVYVNLKNTGGETAYVSATGEVLVSLYGSAYGEEVQEVLDYVSTSIDPEGSRWLSFGTFTTAPGWHYVVQVHITWNGGTLELSRIVT